MLVIMTVTVFWNTTLHRQIAHHWLFRQCIMFLQNTGNQLSDYMALHTRRQWPSKFPAPSTVMLLNTISIHFSITEYYIILHFSLNTASKLYFYLPLTHQIKSLLKHSKANVKTMWTTDTSAEYNLLSAQTAPFLKTKG